MHRILVASALLSPLLFTAAAVARQTPTDSSATTMTAPVSTGVIPARVVEAHNVKLNSGYVHWDPAGTEVLLKLNIDQDGTAQVIQVVDSSNPAINGPVIDAVRQFRFSPAKLDNQPIPIDMNMILTVEPVGLQP
jgi:outer membrane biosynthesis protein TonB